jgi:hypothetical protein
MKKKQSLPPSNDSLTPDQIRVRLADIDLAQTSAIRDLEMDISCDSGQDVADVVEEARQLLEK